MSEGEVPTRVVVFVVFVDYQNFYKGARAAFCDGSTNHIDGQVHPLKLGGVLKGLRDSTRQLVSVRMYRGMPSNQHDPKGYSAALRQISLWRQNPVIEVCTRPLNYRNPYEPKEKGIDVLLAIDFVMMAMKNEYDVGILCSADTDLVPALEAVADLKGDSACETAGWLDSKRPSHSPLGVKGHVIMKHPLSQRAYDLVHDPTDYVARRRRR
jgi:hypothetical protein